MAIRFNWLVAAAAALLFVFAAPACKKDSGGDSKGSDDKKEESKKEDSKADEDKPSGETATDSGGDSDSGTASAVALDDKMLAHFAKDSEVLVSINLAQLRKGSLWKTLSDPLEQATANSKEFAEFKEKCGFNPVEKVQHMMAGGVAGASDKLTVMMRGIGRAEIKNCKDINYSEEGDLATIKDGDDEVWLAWVDDQTFLMSPEGSKEFITARHKGEDGMSAADALGGHLKLADTKADIWFVGTGDELSQGLAATGAKDVQALFVGISLADGLKVDAGLKLGSEDAAKSTTSTVEQAIKAMAGQIPPQMKDVGALLTKLEVKQDGETTRFELALNQKEADTLASTMLMMTMMGQGSSSPAGTSAAKPVEK